MGYSAIQDTPITIDVVNDLSKTTGWSVSGTDAIHDACNSGSILNTQYQLQAGVTYQVSWSVVAISSGYVQLQTPGSDGAMQTTTGLYIETVTPTSTGYPSYFSNGTCTITAFNIAIVSQPIGTTMIYSNQTRKWETFATFYPDFGISLFDAVYSWFNGSMYVHDQTGESTNNFYGTPYQSLIQVVFAANPSIINTYEVLSYQSNMLLVSTIDGITTPTGQVTTLIDTDFIKDILTNGSITVTSYQNNNVYSASFKGDSNESTIEGSPMQSNYLTVTLQTVDGSSLMKLFSIAVKVARLWQGNR